MPIRWDICSKRLADERKHSLFRTKETSWLLRSIQRWPAGYSLFQDYQWRRSEESEGVRQGGGYSWPPLQLAQQPWSLKANAHPLHPYMVRSLLVLCTIKTTLTLSSKESQQHFCYTLIEPNHTIPWFLATAPQATVRVKSWFSETKNTLYHFPFHHTCWWGSNLLGHRPIQCNPTSQIAQTREPLIGGWKVGDQRRTIELFLDQRIPK